MKVFTSLLTVAIVSIVLAHQNPDILNKIKTSKKMKEKLKIEIWSDFVCPFCYIGKRKLDQALEQFEHRDSVEIVWHSYQLFPNYQQKEGSNFFEEVGKLKSISKEQSIHLHSQITQYAKAAGLAYNFDNIAFPNTFMAHRFTHYAKEHNLQNEAEENLFKAYFTEGKNINDIEVLIQLGKEIGLNGQDIRNILNSSQFADEVRSDISRAQELGINGVPYFVVNNKVAFSGAQDSTAILEVLNREWENWKRSDNRSKFNVIEGESCEINGQCK